MRLRRLSIFFGLAIVSLLEAIVRCLFVEAAKSLLTLSIQKKMEDAGRGRYRSV